MRNPKIAWAGDLIERIFDKEERDLGIDMETREELSKAFLSNNQALLHLIHRFPIYKIYRKCENPSWRAMILASCPDTSTAAIALGLQDSDIHCRTLAYEKLNYREFEPFFMEQILEPIFQGQDDDTRKILVVLAKNKLLPVKYLERVRDRLFKIGTYDEALQAERTLREVRSKVSWLQIAHGDQFYEQGFRSGAQFAELFGDYGWTAFPKIDLVGIQLRMIYDEIKDRLTEIERTLKLLSDR